MPTLLSVTKDGRDLTDQFKYCTPIFMGNNDETEFAVRCVPRVDRPVGTYTFTIG